MIIDNTYFRGDIYIPHAKPSITDDITSVEDDILYFIDEYSRNCLLKCLGHVLFNEFEAVLDDTVPEGVDPIVEDKWEDLLNGKEYVDPNTGETIFWRGIRYKTKAAGNYDRSFLADYVYFYYERNDHITRSDIGNQKENAKNADRVTPRTKVVIAWNKFVDAVQGAEYNKTYFTHRGLPCVDYMYNNADQEVSLYKFINDSNNIAANTYAGFKPYRWNRINRFDL